MNRQQYESQLNSPNPSLSQRVETFRTLCVVPALSAMVFLRRNLGYRLLHPGWLLSLTFAFLFLSAFVPDENGRTAFIVYAASIGGLGLRQRIARWFQFRKGIINHSYYVGDSKLEPKWFPQALRRWRRFSRFVDPLICVAVGFLIGKYVNPGLGLWIIFSGFALSVVENTVHRNEWNRALDTYDSLVNADVQTDTVKQYSHLPSSSTVVSTPPRALPTGIGPDIAGRVSARNDRRASTD